MNSLAHLTRISVAVLSASAALLGGSTVTGALDRPAEQERLREVTANVAHEVVVEIETRAQNRSDLALSESYADWQRAEQRVSYARECAQGVMDAYVVSAETDIENMPLLALARGENLRQWRHTTRLFTRYAGQCLASAWQGV